MKKLLSMIMVLALVLASCSFAMASGSPENPNNPVVTVTNTTTPPEMSLALPTEGWVADTAAAVLAGEKDEELAACTLELTNAEPADMYAVTVKNYKGGDKEFELQTATVYAEGTKVVVVIMTENDGTWAVNGVVNAAGNVVVTVPADCLKVLKAQIGLLIIMAEPVA